LERGKSRANIWAV